MGCEVRSKQPDFCSHSSQTCIGPAGALPIQVKTSSLPLPQALPLLHPPSLLRMSLRYDGVQVIMVVVLPKESHLSSYPVTSHTVMHTVILLASPVPKLSTVSYPRVGDHSKSSLPRCSQNHCSFPCHLYSKFDLIRVTLYDLESGCSGSARYNGQFARWGEMIRYLKTTYVCLTLLHQSLLMPSRRGRHELGCFSKSLRLILCD
jgi:hypothetical protein